VVLLVVLLCCVGAVAVVVVAAAAAAAVAVVVWWWWCGLMLLCGVVGEHCAYVYIGVVHVIRPLLPFPRETTMFKHAITIKMKAGLRTNESLCFATLPAALLRCAMCSKTYEYVFTQTTFYNNAML